jgi:AcrR family transcriptional regulator
MPKKEQYHHGDLKNALIQAGIEILSQQGIHALSLRKVARKVGVSHAAPYAHFADKQALIAAISTEGYRILYEKVRAAVREHDGDPLAQLVEAGWAYAEFALTDPAHFGITLSGVVEQETDYPDFVEVSEKSFDLVVEIVEACQRAGILRAGPSDLMASCVWAQVHGCVVLALDDRISRGLLERYSLREILVFALDQLTTVKIEV